MANDISQIEKSINLTWLQKHERLVFGVLATVVLLLLGNWFINHSSDMANARATAAEQVAKIAQQDADKLVQLAQQALAQKDQVIATLEAQNEKLTAANIAIASATKKQQAIDKTLPPNELAARWQAITPGMNPGDVKPTSDGNFSVTTPGAVSTVVQLEQVPGLIDQLNNASNVIQNKDKELGAASKSIEALQHETSGLFQVIDANDKACEADKKNIKAQARRSKRNWFLRGLGVGAVIAQVAAHLL